MHVRADLKLPSHTRWADVQSLINDVESKKIDTKSPGILAGYIMIRTPLPGLQILKKILRDIVSAYNCIHMITFNYS